MALSSRGLVTKVQHLLRRLAQPSPEPPLHPSGRVLSFSERERGGVTLRDAEADAFNDVEVELLAAAAGRPLLQKKIPAILRRAVIDGLHEGGGARAEQMVRAGLTPLTAEFDKPIGRWTIVVPIFGLELTHRQRVNANDVILRNATPAALMRAMSLARKSRRSDVNLDWAEGLIGLPAAFVRVEAYEEAVAIELARDKARNVLECLNAFAGLWPSIVRLGIKGEEWHGAEEYLCVREAPDGESRWHFRRVGPIHSILLDELRSKIAALWGAPEAMGLLRLKQRTPFQDALLRALRWVGVASVEPDPARALVHYATALEAILVPRGGDISYRLCLRCALLLGDRTGHRTAIFNSVKKMYETRSAIVHRGTAAVDPNLQRDARAVARKVLARLLMDVRFRQIDTLDQLEECFGRMTLAPTSARPRRARHAG